MDATSNTKTATLTVGNKTYDFPILSGTVGPDVIDIAKLYGQAGMFTYDPGFTSTGSCQSKITYIDGDAGNLEYRGYSIEQLAEKGDFLETCYLLLYGELPTPAQKADFDNRVIHHTMVHEQLARLYHEGDPKWGFIPDNPKNIAQLFYTFTQSGSAGDLDRFIDPSYQWVRYDRTTDPFGFQRNSEGFDIRAGIAKFVDNGICGVLWTSHNMYEVQAVCDRVLFLSHGRIVLEGDPKTLPKEHGAATLDDLFVNVAQEALHNGSGR